ncbi:MAG: hypothetical protein JXB13_00600 [Phycisphaerae bacterium]|nr:hypothetical protein [Phycisphaerae bacterium]
MSKRRSIVVVAVIGIVVMACVVSAVSWRTIARRRDAALATAEQAFLESVQSWDANAVYGRGTTTYMQSVRLSDMQKTLEEIRVVTGEYRSHKVKHGRVDLRAGRPSTATVAIDGTFEKLTVRFDFKLVKAPGGQWLIDDASLAFPEGTVKTSPRSSGAAPEDDD